MEEELNEIEEIEKLVKKVEEKVEEFTKLKRQIKLLRNRCWICGYTKLVTKEKFITRHSIVGKHRKPHIYLCLNCHKKIEIWKRAIKILDKKEGLTLKKFKQVIKSFDVTI